MERNLRSRDQHYSSEGVVLILYCMICKWLVEEHEQKKKSRKLTESSRRNWSGIGYVLKEDLSTQVFGEPQVSKIYFARNGLINSLA